MKNNEVEHIFMIRISMMTRNMLCDDLFIHHSLIEASTTIYTVKISGTRVLVR